MLKLYILSVIAYYLLMFIVDIAMKKDIKSRGLKAKKKGVFEKFKLKAIFLVMSLIPIFNLLICFIVATDCVNIYEKVIAENYEKIEEV